MISRALPALLLSFLFLSGAAFAQPKLKFGDPLPANAFVELAKAINPAVVNISTTTLPKQRGPRDPMLDMLQQFYGLPAMPQQQAMQALGTGFIIRDDGLIVTNNHVIAGADVINVQLTEGSKKFYEAKVIGSDERTDIALIKINADHKLPVAELGNSKDLEVGEWVAAFGNPFGQGHTLTKGIISAKGRSLGEINKFPLLQTDTPINPGNSGGPLVNMKGLVIGVNSAIDARAQGIGFAIPIDEVKAVIPQLEKNGSVRKAFLGVTLDELSPQAAVYLGMKDTNGALIVGVERGSPAAHAGLRPYDVVREFNGKKITDPQELMDAVADAPIGKSVKMSLIREGHTRQLSLSLTERASEARRSRDVKKYTGQKAPFDLGFVVADSNDGLKKEFQIDLPGVHPVITEVNVQSAAADAGLEPGDVILEVNRKQTPSSVEVLKLIKKGTNSFRVARNGGFAIIVLQTDDD
jgi:serine protease Do